ncbi:MAG: hydroxyacid dehydrogenase [Candidatus Methanofastidiosia archaeon]
MKVLIASDIADDALSLLQEHFVVDSAIGLDEVELAQKVHDYDVLVVRSKPKVTKKILENASKLKIVARAGVGLDNIDLETCKERGISVINSPTALSESVAELVFAMMLSFERNIVRSDNSMKEGSWIKKELKGRELFGKTIGIIGFGRIGSHIAMIANGFRMKVIGYDVNWNEELASKTQVKYASLQDLLRKSDYVTLHVPLLPQTRGMISKDELSMMKDSALLINTSRGGVVDEKALYEALKSDTMRGACLDVFENEPPTDSPLLALDSVLLTPHLGASTSEAQKRAGVIVAEKIIEELKR